MISVGKDLESQFCMSQLFSVIYFTFHCHKMLSLLAIRGKNPVVSTTRGPC